MRSKWVVVALVLTLISSSDAVEEYTIDGTFNGCTHGKLYALVGGGILECQEYNYL